MDSLTKIELNTNYDNTLKNDDYSHNYSIFLEKNKYYFIELINKNDYEFNLKIFDSSYNKINTNDNINNISSKLIDYSEIKEEKNEIKEEMEAHNKYIEEKYKDESSEEDIDIGKDDNMKIVLVQDEFTDNIEIILEIQEDILDDKDTEQYIDAIQNLKKLRDYNNKIYLKVKKSDNYIINVRSEYENEEGEYCLSIKEVEDITMIHDKNIIIGESKQIKFKKKFVKEKFFINLDSNCEYILTLDGTHIIAFILGDNDTFSNNNTKDQINFCTKDGGKYMLEIISTENNCETELLLEKVNKITFYNDEILSSNLEKSVVLEDNSTIETINTIEGKFLDKIYLKDICNDDKYALVIENGKLLVEKVIH